MPKPSKSYLVKVARAMARNGITFREAMIEEEVAMTTEEMRTQERTDVFQAMLREAVNEFSQEYAADLTTEKSSIVGRMMIAGDRLMAMGQPEKAATTYLSAAKVLGHVGAETSVTVVGNLTSQEMEQVRKQIAEKAASGGGGKKSPADKSVN